MAFWVMGTNISVDPAASIFVVNIAITWVELSSILESPWRAATLT
jgi:hypothetical protein